MTAIFTPENMRKRFHDLRKSAENIEMKARPYRDEYDRVSQEAEAKLKTLAGKFKEIEAPLFDIKNEMGMLARALNGKTGEA